MSTAENNKRRLYLLRGGKRAGSGVLGVLPAMALLVNGISKIRI
jgi:hypothetical protein